MRNITFLVLGFALLGCRGAASPGPVDPFLGPTRVPPPATGSVYTPPPDPYYFQPQSVAPQSMAPVSAFPQASISALGGASVGGNSVGSRPAETWSATPSFAGATLVSDAATPDLRPQPDPLAAASATVNREPIIRVLEPAPRAAPAPTERLYNPTPTRVVNIVDLPRVAPADPGAGFRLVSAVEPNNAANPVVLAAGGQPAQAFVPPAGNYGFDPSYAWLRGRLEYSQVDRQWKLRYIPVDGNTDQYGGSVVVANEAALAGCERGEFVAVHGRVTGTGGDHGFAPLYEVTSLQRLGR